MSSTSKKENNQLNLLFSNNEGEENERELSFYVKDRIKLMKEVLKIIKPREIRAMAPDCLKDLNIQEINSMLLEELLGISNKRLTHIINGENIDEDSSSTDPEEEKPPVDVISLDDITDSDDDICFDDNSNNPVSNRNYIKKEKLKKNNKNEGKIKTDSANNDLLSSDKVMNVLELLELQARARAIRSQLFLENLKKNEQNIEERITCQDSDAEAVIVESPKLDEIVIESSDSDNESKESTKMKKLATVLENTSEKDNENIKFQQNEEIISNECSTNEHMSNIKNNDAKKLSKVKNNNSNNIHMEKNNLAEKSDSENDGIIINVDEGELCDIENSGK